VFYTTVALCVNFNIILPPVYYVRQAALSLHAFLIFPLVLHTSSSPFFIYHS